MSAVSSELWKPEPKPKRQPKAEKLAAAMAAGLEADRAHYKRQCLRPMLHSWVRPIGRPELLGHIANLPGMSLPSSTCAVIRVDPELHGFRRTLLTVGPRYWEDAVRTAADGRLYGPTDVYGYDFRHGGMSLSFVSVEATL